LNSRTMRRRCLWETLASLLPLVVAGCGPTGYKITPIPVDKTLEETELERESLFASDKIVLIDVEGVLMNKTRRGLLSEGEHPVSLLLEKLHKAEKDSSVRGIVLRINSPGGSVTASDLMYREILEVRGRSKKPVATVMMDVAASGGYYIACATDHIIALPTTVTGSIGVIMQMFTVRRTLDKLGVTPYTIKSGPNKDAGSPFKDMTDGERAIFQSLIDDFYGRFLAVVKAGRPKLTEGKIRELADGRVYTAQQALEAGLIDEIGSVRRAVDWVREKSGAGKIRLIAYNRPLAWKPNIYARAPVSDSEPVRTLQIQLPSWLRNGTPRFMYLWAP